MTSAIRPAEVVPGSSATAALTMVASGALALVAVFAMALAMSAGRLADRWQATLADTATLRVIAAPDQIDALAETALELLRTTPGIAAARLQSADEQRALLAPWFGPDLPVEALALPRLIEIEIAATGFDVDGLRQRLAGQVPDAVLDDHARWRRPLVQGAGALRRMALLAVALTVAALVAMVALAAGFALAANAGSIRVLRLVGARDTFIVRAFTRRFALRALAGAATGVALGLAALAVLPQDDAGVLSDLGPRGLDWLWMLVIPPVAGLVAWVTTRIAAFRVLKGEG